MIILEFVRNTPPYMAGETAGFSEADAARLIRLGAAKNVGSDGEVIEGTIESRPDDSDPGIQIDAQGPESVEEKPAEDGPDSKPKRPYVRKQKNSKE